MTHKADERFFDTKRLWSQRKDEILSCYLTAYLPKIMMLRKPILIVDGFAGPGRFKDGQGGSPLIICECIQTTLGKNLKHPQEIELWCIEKTPTLYEQLESNLKPFGFAKSQRGTFSDFAVHISRATSSRSVFLYVDPFTVEGLVWNELETMFRGLQIGSSVEVLLNLNSSSFVRRGLAALKTSLDEMDDESSELVDAETEEIPQIDRLDEVAGSDWWQKLISQRKSYPETVLMFTQGFCERLRLHFKEVVFHPVKAQPHHRVPKYYLVFGTRHADGLELMNDEMVKSRRVLADMAKPKVPTLFETRSEELVPDLESLPDLIREIARAPATRKNVIVEVIRRNFCQFHRTEIRGCIERLLESKQLVAETGKTEVNDKVRIWSASE